MYIAIYDTYICTGYYYYKFCMIHNKVFVWLFIDHSTTESSIRDCCRCCGCYLYYLLFLHVIWIEISSNRFRSNQENSFQDDRKRGKIHSMKWNNTLGTAFLSYWYCELKSLYRILFLSDMLLSNINCYS